MERDNADEVLTLAKNVGDAIIYLPRPIPAEKIAAVKPYTKEFRMPESTWKRLSKKAREIVGDSYKIETRRGRFAKLSVETVTTILALHRSGVSVRKIAEEFGIPKSTVHYILKRGVKVEDGDIKLILDQ